MRKHKRNIISISLFLAAAAYAQSTVTVPNSPTQRPNEPYVWSSSSSGDVGTPTMNRPSADRNNVLNNNDPVSGMRRPSSPDPIGPGTDDRNPSPGSLNPGTSTPVR